MRLLFFPNAKENAGYTVIVNRRLYDCIQQTASYALNPTPSPGLSLLTHGINLFSLYSDVTVTSWGPSRFDIFALGLKRDLQHKYYQTDHYSEWESLGGDRLIGKPAVASPRADAFDIVVSRNAGSVARSYLSKAYDGSRWIPDIGGYYNQTGVFAGEAAAVSWSNTTVAYFGVSTPEDQLVFRLWWGAGWFPEDGSWFKLADLAKGKDAVAQGSGPEMEL